MVGLFLRMSALSSDHECLNHTCTITHPSLLDLLFDGYLYSLGTYVCVGTTIQEKGRNSFGRYLYLWGTCK